VFWVTGNLEEAEGKALASRTGSEYEAAQRGEAANIVKVRNLHGTLRRRSVCRVVPQDGEATPPLTDDFDQKSR
jgi:hypothetical protein